MIKRIFMFTRWVLPAVFILAVVCGAVTGAQAAPNFKGKVVVLIAPVSAGGGTDISSRLISRHLGKYLPGKPNIVVRNMPGASALIGINYVWHARPNGLILGLTDGKANIQNLVRPKGTDFKLEEFNPLYAFATGTVLYGKPGVIKSPKDLIEGKGLIAGFDTPEGGTGFSFVAARELLGVPVAEKVVFGYAGSGPRRLAFQGEELTGSVESTVGYFTNVIPMVKAGKAVPIFQSGVFDEKGNIVRDAEGIPTVPEIYRQIHDKEVPAGLALDMYRIMVGGRTLGKILIAPPKTPEEILDVYGKAVKQMVKDPKFLHERDRLIPGSGYFDRETLLKIYLDGISARPEVVTYMKKVLSDMYGVKFI